MRYLYDNKAVCLNHVKIFSQTNLRYREVFSEKKELLLCLLSLISETGGKFAAHVKNEERKYIAEDKGSPA